MPPSEGYITTDDGIRLFFRTVGAGPQIVLIPNGFHALEDFRRLASGRTLVFYDLRNRGYSDAVSDGSKLTRGVHHDVDDLDAVRRHFGIDQADVIGHSYVGTMVGLYGMKYPAHARRLVMIGAMQPVASKQYPKHLAGADALLSETLAKLSQLHMDRPEDPIEFCRRFWATLRPIYVANPADAEKINWDRCDLENERNFGKCWAENILPSLHSLTVAPDEFAKATAMVLVVHGAKDRSSPYGGARDWTQGFPNARLVTFENAAHAPWIEAPELFFDSVEPFLDGRWPDAAEQVS